MHAPNASFRVDNLATPLAAEVRRLILDGRLPPGARLNELQIARSLGVSRAPLREALAALEQQGLVRLVARRGCFVAEADPREVRDIYPLRAMLDPAALRLAGPPGPARRRELAELNRRIRRADSPEKRIDLDNAWHRLLIADCPNGVLLDLIETLIVRTERYERLYFRERGSALVAADEHDAVLGAIDADDLDGACAALQRNMKSALPVIVAWIERRSTPSGSKEAHP